MYETRKEYDGILVGIKKQPFSKWYYKANTDTLNERLSEYMNIYIYIYIDVYIQRNQPNCMRDIEKKRRGKVKNGRVFWWCICESN